MMIRSMMLALAVGAVGSVGCMDTGEVDTSTATGNTIVPNFECANVASLQVLCTGDVLILPITINVKDVGVLNDSDLDILSNDLNHVSILNGDILNHNKILNDLEVTVLQDFLNKFNVDVSKNEIDVCTTVLGFLLCK